MFSLPRFMRPIETAPSCSGLAQTTSMVGPGVALSGSQQPPDGGGGDGPGLSL